MMRRWMACLTALVVVAAPVAARAGTSSAEASSESRAAAGLPDLTRVAAAALPAVVGIVTAERERNAPKAGDPLKDLYEKFRGDAPRKGLATGFIIDPAGYIITNAHVVDTASRVEIEIGDDEERMPARVLGADEATDVALLKVDPPRPLPTVRLGDSDRLRVAEWVMVMGSPFGLSQTVTIGIVSHLGRSDIAPSGHDGYYDFIQTDASINPGNSGGPLVNVRGEVVGIATAINATGQGIGFAVPINMAKDILEQLRERGRVTRSWMGVSGRAVHGGKAGQAHDIIVTDVVHGGPAAESGLRVGDVITSFDGHGILSAARLRWYVAIAGVGRSVALGVRRGGAVESMRVSLAELPGAATATAGTLSRDPATEGSGFGGKE